MNRSGAATQAAPETDNPLHFTIDSDNILTVHETAPTAEPETIAINSERDLRKATADWPIARLVEVWNGFAGVVPLGDLKPVKKFTDRTTALKRIWSAMRRLEEHFTEEKQSHPAPKVASASRQTRRAGAQATAASQTSAAPPAAVIPAPAPKPASGPTERKRRSGTQSAAVITLLERAGGATLEELGQATGWQKHYADVGIRPTPSAGSCRRWARKGSGSEARGGRTGRGGPRSKNRIGQVRWGPSFGLGFSPVGLRPALCGSNNP